MKHRMVSILLIAILCSISLAACAKAKKAEKAVVPLFPNAVLDSGKYEDIRQSTLLSRQKDTPDLNIEMTAYTTSATVVEVIAFYEEQLKDWETQELLGGQGGASFKVWVKVAST